DGTIYVIGPAGLPGRNEIFPTEVRRTVVAVGYLGLAVRAERAQQALRHDAENSGVEQITGHAQVEQTGDGRGRVVSMQRGEHEVTGKRGLDGHFGRFQIADLAHHDDVRVLAH